MIDRARQEGNKKYLTCFQRVEAVECVQNRRGKGAGGNYHYTNDEPIKYEVAKIRCFLEKEKKNKNKYFVLNFFFPASTKWGENASRKVSSGKPTKNIGSICRLTSSSSAAITYCTAVFLTIEPLKEAVPHSRPNPPTTLSDHVHCRQAVERL